QRQRELLPARQLHKRHDPLLSSTRLVDDLAVGDFRELLEDPVDLGCPDAHPTRLQHGVGAAKKRDAAGVAMDAYIISMPPHMFVGIEGEVGVSIVAAARVVPE